MTDLAHDASSTLDDARTSASAYVGPDPLEIEDRDRGGARQRFILDDTGFNEVPKKWRKFYRRWQGQADSLAPNEVLCPVCKVVIRSSRELRPGDRVYCMPCMARLVVVRGEGGRLEGEATY